MSGKEAELRGRLLLLNGPNLNLLGTREPKRYGVTRLRELEESLTAEAQGLGWQLDTLQSNHEGVLIERIHQAGKESAGIIFNPAGYGHTSVALRDALLAVDCPSVEVHISNIAAREDFRHQTLTAPVSVGSVSGFGVYGYRLALYALHMRLTGIEC